MKNLTRIGVFSLLAALVLASPLLAQDDTETETQGQQVQGTTPLIEFSGAFGAGLVSIGAAFGIGRLASSAVESMAGQPEVAGSIQTAMIIAAALIEGFTFFALVICQGQNPWG